MSIFGATGEAGSGWLAPFLCLASDSRLCELAGAGPGGGIGEIGMTRTPTLQRDETCAVPDYLNMKFRHQG
jgi:hypothetical protein